MTRDTCRSSRLAAWMLPALLAAPLLAGEPQAQAPAPAAVHAITWSDRQPAVEQWLREAPIARTEQIPIGVTKPSRIYFTGEGAARSAAWKPLAPGHYKGFWESYKSEVAAYELDKLLELGMVPPTVERTIRGNRGAVIMWVEGVKGWDIKNPVIAPDPVAWTREVVRMKMFDQLIGNIDRNAGNLMYDGDYHIVLIDHSRAFTTTTDLRRMSPPTRIDKQLWSKMEALTQPGLEAALGKWVGRSELRSLLERRNRMRKLIDEMVRERGEMVFIP